MPTDTSVRMIDSSAEPQADAPLVLDFEDELDSALDGMEAGMFVELSLEDADVWAQAASPDPNS
jgi:hypothetical protein